MLSTHKQLAFKRIFILSGIILAAAISSLIYINNLNKAEQTNTSNIDIIEPESKTVKKNENNLFTITTTTDIEKLSGLNPFFQIDAIDTYHVFLEENTSHYLTVAKYTDEQGRNKKALIYLPEVEASEKTLTNDKNTNVLTPSDKPSQFRFERWLGISEAIKKHTNEQSLFISYWDNSQRIHLLTGRETWINEPDKNAYNSTEEQTLWKSVAGGFDTEGKLSKYSQILLLHINTAITELQKELPKNRKIYLLVSNDDLAHVQEIAALTGQGLPLETKLFPVAAELHNSISKVKEWAKEGDGTGSYLVQPISEKFNRVWRITDKSFEDSLLVRLLPFTSSLDKPFDKTKLVYQSDWGAYLSIYQLID